MTKRSNRNHVITFDSQEATTTTITLILDAKKSKSLIHWAFKHGWWLSVVMTFGRNEENGGALSLGKTSESLKYVTMLKRAAVIHFVENSRVEEAEVEEKNEEEMNRPGSGPSLCFVTALYLDDAPRDFGLKVAFFLRVARLLIQLSDRKWRRKLSVSDKKKALDRVSIV